MLPGRPGHSHARTTPGLETSRTAQVLLLSVRMHELLSSADFGMQ